MKAFKIKIKMANFETELKMLGLKLTKQQINNLRSKAFEETRAKQVKDFMLNNDNKAQSILITMAIARSLWELLMMFYEDSKHSNKKQRADLKNLRNKCKMVVKQYEQDIKGAVNLTHAFKTISNEFSEMIYVYLEAADKAVNDRLKK